MIPISPLFCLDIDEPEFGLKAYIAIHNLGIRGAAGGIRCTPDIQADEAKTLARAMAYKYSFFQLELGGAKGAMIVDYDASPERRKELANRLGYHIALLLRSGAYHAWTDMNFFAEQVDALYAGAGVPRTTGTNSSARRTALTTFASVKATADFLGLKPADCRIAIEGLGAVGGILAEQIADWGGRLVAISNRIGTLTAADGLPVEQLLACREQHGAEFVLEPGLWTRLATEELFHVEADILVPAARVGSISGDVARRLPVRGIVPAANVPCTADGEIVLQERHILLLPDFVVNAGGVLGVFQNKSTEERFYDEECRAMVSRMLRSAAALGKSAINAGRAIADANYSARGETFLKPRSTRQRIAAAIADRIPLPGQRRRARAMREHQLLQTVQSYFADQ